MSFNTPDNPQAVNPRDGITTHDTLVGILPRTSCTGAGVIRLGASCDTSGATLTCRVVFLDAQGNFVAVSNAVTFTADGPGAAWLDGPRYVATPNIDAWFPSGGASVFAVHVDAVSAGTWSLLPVSS